MAGNRRKAAVVFLVLCIAAVLGAPALAAGEPEFRIDMDRLQLQQGVGTDLVVSMINARGAEIERIDGLEHFDVLSRSHSTSLRIVNGVSTEQIDVQYTIAPKTAGQFVLKAVFRYDGKIYESNELQVTVSDAPPDGGQADGDLFVRTVLSHEEAYLGEKIVVVYELYSRYRIENFGFSDYVAVDGAVAEDATPNPPEAEYVYLDGVRYAKYIAKRLILDPIRTGTLALPSYRLQVNVLAGGSGLLGRFFTRTEAVMLQTEAAELTIKPLPEERRPADFSGIVGNLTLDGSYSRTELQYGDSLALNVTASCGCSLDGLKKLFSGGIPGFAVYETQKGSSAAVDENNRYSARKEFEAILVPERSGVIEIAPVSISYFNPAAGAYERAEIPGAAVTVLGGPAAPAQPGAGAAAPAGPGAGDAGIAAGAAVETIRITQVSYAAAGGAGAAARIAGRLAEYAVPIAVGAAVLLAAAVFAVPAWKRRKRDGTLKALYRRLMAAKDVQEAYDLFNAMIKHRFRVSVKAAPLSDVRELLPNAELADRVAEIVEYMESREGKDCAELKSKVKRLYRLLSA